MEKLDLTKTFRSYYSAKAKPQLIEVEQASFLALEGQGDPSGEDFLQNIEALYSVAYAVKFICKALSKDFVVAKLEGLWWFDEAKYGMLSPAEAPQKVPREAWQYRLLLRMPGYVTTAQVKEAVSRVITKKQLQKAGEIYFYTMTEGKAIQALHVGPFATEPETLAKLQEYADEHKLQKNGLHHEIYLSDFRKTPPEKLKTILREPVK